MLKKLNPDVEYLRGKTTVPAKAVSYTKDSSGHVIESTKPNTHKFENELRADLKKELEGLEIFPTKGEIFLNILYGIHSEHDYKTHDLDNRTKTIMDALKDVVYVDDSQVSILRASKEFLKNSQESYLKINVKILTDNLKAQLLKSIL